MQSTVIFRNEEKVSNEEVVKLFTQTLEDSETFEKSEIEELSDIVSKSCIDKFIVYTKPEVVSMQGDLLIWSDSTEEYKREFPRVTDLEVTSRMALQDDDSITGDHCLVPLKNAKFTLKTGKFIPSILEGHTWGSNAWDCKILDTNSPFVIRHREHGNITLPSGKYMICSSMNSESLTKMRD
jgi:hypothetical protein